jgi:hypothetical protein
MDGSVVLPIIGRRDTGGRIVLLVAMESVGLIADYAPWSPRIPRMVWVLENRIQSAVSAHMSGRINVADRPKGATASERCSVGFILIFGRLSHIPVSHFTQTFEQQTQIEGYRPSLELNVSTTIAV